MATPPFNIDENTPSDDGIVSQFPAAERTFRDVVEDWISVEHDTSGLHKQVSLDHVSDPTGTAGYTTLWANSVGDLRFRVGTGTVTSIIPPGVTVPYAGTTAPDGWLLCYGQTVSQATYAALYAVLGTTYGSDAGGNFTLPDLRGRVVAGQDDMGGTSANRLTDADDGLNGDTLGDTGGAETQVLVEANLAAHTHGSGTLAGTTNTTGAHTHTVEGADGKNVQGGSSSQAADNANKTTSSNGDHSHTVTISSGATGSTGSGTAFGIVQPTIILNYIIKY